MPIQSACIDSVQLRAYVRGGLPSQESQAIRKHLLECSVCQGKARVLAKSAAETGAATPLPAKVESGAMDLSFLKPAQTSDELGRLGGFRVLRLIGQGGMAMVFEAEDLHLQRSVALKVMKTWKDETVSMDRFIREARSAASIKNEHLITVYQVGQDQGIIFLAMELLDGETLESWRSRLGRPTPKTIARVAREIASGLQAIHAKGLIHRDIKPSNIWIEAPSGKVRILDFGLARAVKEEMRITQTGMIVGTPAFMSPEQARGEELDERSDLFSLGCVLYYLCAGSEPFKGDTIMAQIMALATIDPKPIHEIDPSIPRRLSDLIMKMLAKAPKDRPPSAAEFLKQLTKPTKTEELRGANGDEYRVQPAIQGGPAPATPDTEPIISPRSRVQRRVDVAPRLPGPKWLPWALLSLGMILMLFVGIAVGPHIIGGRTKETQSSHRDPGPDHPSKRDPGRHPHDPPVDSDAVYLADLRHAEAVRWPHKPPPGVKNLPDFFKEISVGGRIDPKGLGMHADPEGPVSLTYVLQPKRERFKARVSINDTSRESEKPVTFIVRGDGKQLWRSQPVREQSDAQDCDVSLRGVGRLTLEVIGDRNVRGAHAVWLDARVLPAD